MKPARTFNPIAPVARVSTSATPASRFGLPDWFKSAPFIALHLALVAVFFVPVGPTVLLLCGLTYFLRMFGITGGYHRYFAHRAYKTSRLFQFVLAWLGCSTMQKGPLWWAAHHREHHRHSDTPSDPHSPHETSFWWAHVGWILSSEHVETPWEAIQDWSRYPELRWLDRNHWVPGLVLAVLCWLVAGWSGLVWGFVVSTILVYHATFTINSLSHLFGSRRYATPDDSRNNLLLALLTLGEGWHNNHHHYQSSANQGFFWYEIDISYAVIWLLSWVGITRDLRKPGAKALAHRLTRPPPRGSGLAEMVSRTIETPAAPVVQAEPAPSASLSSAAGGQAS
jgi:stearoyl-CoA desaturase (delta-9 desaturase)